MIGLNDAARECGSVARSYKRREGAIDEAKLRSEGAR